MQTVADQSLSVAAQLYTSRGWNVHYRASQVRNAVRAVLAMVEGEGPDRLG